MTNINTENPILLSIVIPCHNEALNIPRFLGEFDKLITRDDIEVIVVNDGSRDDTSAVLDALPSSYSRFLRVVTNEKGKGYGGAILTGLRVARGEFIGYTHGDLQTPPKDVLRALAIIEKRESHEKIFVKGQRHGRPLLDDFFTMGMSTLESLIFRKKLWDINAQPNIFHRSFFELLKNPPVDFSLDLYMLVMANLKRLEIVRFPVHFGPRLFGESKWNTGALARWKFIKRTITFSASLKRKLALH